MSVGWKTEAESARDMRATMANFAVTCERAADGLRAMARAATPQQRRPVPTPPQETK